jgi:4-carboxymuconolactone decarboxylase
MAESRRERGKQKITEIAQVPAFDPPDAFTAATIDRIFGELWQRPGLGDRDRRLLTLAIVGARGLDFEARVHIAGALKTGDLSPAEMMEVVLHVAHYAGWPHAAFLFRQFRDVCTELGLTVPGPDAID